MRTIIKELNDENRPFWIQIYPEEYNQKIDGIENMTTTDFKKFLFDSVGIEIRENQRKSIGKILKEYNVKNREELDKILQRYKNDIKKNGK